MTVISKGWLEWSFSYELPEDMAHVECKGVRVGGEKDYMLPHFVKKPRGRVTATSTRQYDFSTVLDVYLVIKNAFFDEVFAH